MTDIPTREQAQPTQCDNCGGEGRIVQMMMPTANIAEPCPKCGGTGQQLGGNHASNLAGQTERVVVEDQTRDKGGAMSDNTPTRRPCPKLNEWPVASIKRHLQIVHRRRIQADISMKELERVWLVFHPDEVSDG